MGKRNQIDISAGSHVLVGGRSFVIIEFNSADSVIALDVETYIQSTLKLTQITESYSQSQTGPQIDLQSINQNEWQRVLNIYNILKPLIGKPDRSASEVEQAAQKLLCSRTSAYRYLEKLEAEGTVTALLRKPRLDKGGVRLDPDVDSIIKNVLLEDYLSDKKVSPTVAHTEIKRRCRNAKLPLPALDTVLRRIAAINSVLRAETRHGRNAALDLKPKKGSVPNGEQLNGLWQIDHTPVDIILVDEVDRIAIQRPWITVIIDIFSRMVMGWYISFDTPGAVGTGLCISRAILPKDELLARWGINFPWPSQGKPRILMCDNAKEFRGNMLKDTCSEHGVDLRFRPVKQPHYGAHIERLQGTLLHRIHKLDGTTFSNAHQKGDYDAEKNANMTLVEFEQWLANLILGQYHNEVHSGLGCSPLQKYREGLIGTDTTPGLGKLTLATNPEKLIYDFLPFEYRTIQPSGVQIDNVEYHDPVLDRWIGALEPGKARVKRKFLFRRDPRDISALLFWDPDIKQYFRIPYRNSRHPAISLWELRAIQKHMRDKGEATVNEDSIFEALNEMRSLEESARVLTKKARINQEKRRQHARSAHTRKSVTRPPVSLAEPKTSSILDFSELQPFDEVEPMQ